MNPWGFVLCWAAGVACGGSVAWNLAVAQRDSRFVAELERAHAESALAQAEVENRLRLASRAADVASVELDRVRRSLSEQTKRLNDESKRFTYGRACLDAGAVRVLQRSDAFASEGGGLPKDSAPSDGADSAFATDTDAAGWIADVAERFESCRATVRAIATWDSEVAGGR